MNADLRARILAEAKREPSPLRAEHRRRAGLVVGAGALATVGLFFGMGGSSRGARPVDLVVFASGCALAAAIVLTRASSTRPRSMLPRPRPVLAAVVAASAPVLALFALASAALWPEPAAEDVPLRTHAACAAMTVVQGLLPLAILFTLRRGSDPVHPALSGAALGMTAGAWTAAMAYLRCPHAAASHCIVAHVAPVLLFAIAGAVLGRRMLDIRR